MRGEILMENENQDFFNEDDTTFYDNGDEILINNEQSTFGVCTVEQVKVSESFEDEDGRQQSMERLVVQGTLQINDYLEDIEAIQFGNYFVRNVNVIREVITNAQVYVHYEFVADGVTIVPPQPIKEVGEVE